LVQTTGESRLNDAVKGGADLEEFAGMKEVIKFLLGKFPTGDYCNRYPEDDLSDDDEEDQEMVDRATAKARARQGRLGKGRGGKRGGAGSDEERSDDDDDDDDLDGFIVDSDAEDESEDESAQLPNEVKKLTVGQLRQLVRLGGSRDINCNARPQARRRNEPRAHCTRSHRTHWPRACRSHVSPRASPRRTSRMRRTRTLVHMCCMASCVRARS
jgi:hypothetical protein